MRADRIITYVVGEKTNSYLADVGKYVTFNKNGTSATIKTSYPTSSFQPSNYHNYKNTLVTINGADVTHDLEIIGNNKANVIFGGTQDDTIDGGAGADRISSGDGNDKLFGGKGNDTLNSGIGDDTLWGGEGNDKLYGGDGDDVFYYNTGEGNDTIFGYESGVDKIILGTGSVTNVSYDRSTGDVVFKVGDGEITVNNMAEKAILIYDPFGKVISNYNP